MTSTAEIPAQGAQTICLCLTVCNNYSKCMGFTVSFMLSRRIPKYIYGSMLSKRQINSPVVRCRPFASEMIYSKRFRRILSSPT